VPADRAPGRYKYGANGTGAVIPSVLLFFFFLLPPVPRTIAIKLLMPALVEQHPPPAAMGKGKKISDAKGSTAADAPKKRIGGWSKSTVNARTLRPLRRDGILPKGTSP
jgi:hypothetical protein